MFGMEKWSNQKKSEDADPTNVVNMPASNAPEKPILVQDPLTGQVIGRAGSEAEARTMTTEHIEQAREAA